MLTSVFTASTINRTAKDTMTQPFLNKNAVALSAEEIWALQVTCPHEWYHPLS